MNEIADAIGVALRATQAQPFDLLEVLDEQSVSGRCQRIMELLIQARDIAEGRE